MSPPPNFASWGYWIFTNTVNLINLFDGWAQLVINVRRKHQMVLLGKPLVLCAQFRKHSLLEGKLAQDIGNVTIVSNWKWYWHVDYCGMGQVLSITWQYNSKLTRVQTMTSQPSIHPMYYPWFNYMIEKFR